MYKRFIHPYLSIKFLTKWLVLALIIGFLAGSASAFFLASLHWVEDFREGNLWIVWCLPIGGLVIGLLYHYYGNDVVKGNNQLIEEFHSPKQIIPLKMAPMVLFGTLATHLFGGSAGREGTAVQMGGAIADQFTKWFTLNKSDRKIILILGISAGFASVFGTPLAGAVFSLEVLIIGRLRYEAIIPSVLTAVIAHYVCLFWGIQHTTYVIHAIPELNLTNLFWVILVGIPFGWTAWLFATSNHFFTKQFTKWIKYPPLRPVFGGLILALLFFMIGNSRYMGLGIPVIESAFDTQLPAWDFLAKLGLTAFTLSAGFKGGEVTPLFFIGATLGSFLSFFIPLELSLLAGMGFIAVFAGATNTPLACALMGIELFGSEGAVYFIVVCVIAYLFSGHHSIYTQQIIGSPKTPFQLFKKGKKITDTNHE